MSHEDRQPVSGAMTEGPWQIADGAVASVDTRDRDRVSLHRDPYRFIQQESHASKLGLCREVNRVVIAGDRQAAQWGTNGFQKATYDRRRAPPVVGPVAEVARHQQNLVIQAQQAPLKAAQQRRPPVTVQVGQMDHPEGLCLRRQGRHRYIMMSNEDVVHGESDRGPFQANTIQLRISIPPVQMTTKSGGSIHGGRKARGHRSGHRFPVVRYKPGSSATCSRTPIYEYYRLLCLYFSCGIAACMSPVSVCQPRIGRHAPPQWP